MPYFCMEVILCHNNTKRTKKMGACVYWAVCVNPWSIQKVPLTQSVAGIQRLKPVPVIQGSTG